jgi:hypothetical protein
LEGLRTELSRLKADKAEIDAVKTALADLKAQQKTLIALVKRKNAANVVIDVKDQKASLLPRFQTASTLTNVNQRNDACVGLAQDAALLGDVDMVQKCIDLLALSINSREEAKYKSALRLAQVGKTENALALARSLNNLSMRDQALAKIAKGDDED